MRFCLLETSCEQEDFFPPGINVKVNGKVCQLPVSQRKECCFNVVLLDGGYQV